MYPGGIPKRLFGGISEGFLRGFPRVNFLRGTSTRLSEKKS